MMQLAALPEAAIRQCESHARCSCDVHVGVMRGEPQTIHATEFLVTVRPHTHKVHERWIVCPLTIT